MGKLTSLSIILIISFIANASSDFSNSLSKTLKDDLEKAKTCLPHIGKKNVIFCTGIELSRDFIKEINNNKMHFCIKNIEKNGYRPIIEGSHHKINTHLWKSFYNTTKRAETLHKSKHVFFKKNATKVDCLHELIHVFQWTSQSGHHLSPIERNKKYNRFKKELLTLSDQVAVMEKNNKKRDAVKLALDIQKKIIILNKYSHISSWLDEKDVYYFFYRLCGNDIACNKSDMDTIIGNLFKIKNKLPWKFRNEIIYRAAKTTREKEKSFITNASYNPLVKNDYTLINQLFNQDWHSMIKTIKKNGINLFQFKMSKQHVHIEKKNLIPAKILQTLTLPSKKELLLLANYKKISSKYIFGKFLCKKRNRTNFIIVTNNTSKEIFIQEYMHYLQSLKNPDYCDAITEQNNIALNFKTGKISRKKYESYILKYKILIWKAQSELFNYMLTKSDFDFIDNINNKLQYLIYKTRLTRLSDNFPPTSFKNGKIKLNIIDDLPHININGKSLVMDVGAMDSVIKPEILLNKISLNKIQSIKLKTLRSVSGDTSNAPMVMIKSNIKVGKDISAKNSRWILADLKLAGINGLLGLSFFKNKDFIIHPKKKYIEIFDMIKKPKHTFEIQKDFDNKIRAVEFICPTPNDNIIIRLDSGSQVYGDISNKLPTKIFLALKNKKELLCGKLKISGKFENNLQNGVIFDRNVVLNLGWPWINQFDKISISMKNAWVSFER